MLPRRRPELVAPALCCFAAQLALHALQLATVHGARSQPPATLQDLTASAGHKTDQGLFFLQPVEHSVYFKAPDQMIQILVAAEAAMAVVRLSVYRISVPGTPDPDDDTFLEFSNATSVELRLADLHAGRYVAVATLENADADADESERELAEASRSFFLIEQTLWLWSARSMFVVGDSDSWFEATVPFFAPCAANRTIELQLDGVTVGRSGGMPGAIVRAKLDTESHATPFRCHRVVASISDVTDAAAETASIALCVFADERYRHPQVVHADNISGVHYIGADIESMQQPALLLRPLIFGAVTPFTVPPPWSTHNVTAAAGRRFQILDERSDPVLSIKFLKIAHRNSKHNDTGGRPVAWTAGMELVSPPIYVARLRPPAFVWGKNGVVFNDRGVVYKLGLDPQHAAWNDHSYIRQPPAEALRVDGIHLRHEQAIAVMSDQHCATYYHFTLETLPKIVLFHHLLLKQPEMKVLLEYSRRRTGKDNVKRIFEAFEAFGVNRSRIIEPEPSLWHWADNLYFTNAEPQPNIELLERTRALVLRSLGLAVGVTERRKPAVLVVRREAGGHEGASFPVRLLLNSDEVEARLRAEERWSVDVFTGALSFERTVQRFRFAYVVVGTHGAGLSNMLYHPAGLVIVQLGAGQSLWSGQGDRNVIDQFGDLAIALGHRWWHVSCTMHGDPENMNVEADPDDVHATVLMGLHEAFLL